MSNEITHLLDVHLFTLEDVLDYCSAASEMKEKDTNGLVCDRLKNKILITFFLEPSTRTMCSFQSAMLKLGGQFISIHDTVSSMKKGESLEDSIRSLSYYGDAIVIRHPEKDSSKRCAEVSSVPIINAGDGNGEHPTQALLDIYTILQYKNYTKPLVVVFLGDLKNSRTVHSLLRLLVLFPFISFMYVCPKELQLPVYLTKWIAKRKIAQFVGISLEKAIKVADILYVVRIQKERFTDDSWKEISLQDYSVDAEKMMLAKLDMIVMHPLPRNEELSEEIDSDKRCVYFEQMRNGLYMRMAILDKLLGPK